MVRIWSAMGIRGFKDTPAWLTFWRAGPPLAARA
jgi:hypothetical protein